MPQFLITTDRERIEALGEESEKWMNTDAFSALLTKTSWLEYNADKRNSFSKYQKMLKGERQALPLTQERKTLYIYSMNNIKQCQDVFIPFIEAFFYPLQVKLIEWTDHHFTDDKIKTKYKSSKWSQFIDSDSESDSESDDDYPQQVNELVASWNIDNKDPKTKTITTMTQYLAKDITNALKQMLPDDAYASLALTTVDITDEGYGYVIGKAALRDRVGVVSTARYTDGWDEYIPDDENKGFNWRTMNVIAHEICHMLGITHCVYYHCIMNGSDTGDDRPIFMCPICLKKLAYNIEKITTFDVIKRYELLYQVYEKNGFTNDATWIQERINFIKNS